MKIENDCETVTSDDGRQSITNAASSTELNFNPIALDVT
jgi:hypothetical protein